MYCVTAEVIKQEVMHGGYRVLQLRAPELVPQVQPGQFVHVRVPHMEAAVLRRPFSVYKADGDIDKKSLFRRHGHPPAGTGLKYRFHGGNVAESGR